MKFELTILGCNSAVPAHGRNPSSQVLCVHEQNYLIDCGEGTQMRMLENNIKKSKIRAIFISHLHGDHIYGLIGLLNSYSLSGRDAPLDIYSPPGLEEIINVHLKYSAHPFAYPVVFHLVDPEKSEMIFEDASVQVYSIPLLHRIPTSGYLFVEKEKLPGIKPEMVAKHEIPFQLINDIKRGQDFTLDDGSIIPHRDLINPPPPVRSFAYCSDTMYTEAYLDQIEKVDLLYHESTYAHNLLPLAIHTMHSTALQAATIADKANAGKLILGHYSSRYRDTDILVKEAQLVFRNTEAGVEGKTYAVEQKK